MTELKTQILIVGAGVGGCAAALAAAQTGCRVILTEESDWIGGQLTSQAVPPDEHGWIEHFGCTASYRRFRHHVRAYYQRLYPLSENARAARYLNPGNGWVSPICHEPRVALAVIEAMLAPYQADERISILREHEPVSAQVLNDKIQAVTLRDRFTGKTVTIAAEYVIDATELGDLLPLSGTEYVTGFESQSQTGEPSAPNEHQPHNSQAFSFCFALSHYESEDHTLERPANYEFWRDFVPVLTPAWPGKLLSWTITHPRLMTPHTYHFDPHNEPNRAFAGLWSYRRLLARDNFEPALFSDLCLVNWPQTDYLLGEILDCGEIERANHLAAARQQSLSLVYWLQTEAPRPDGGIGWPGLKLRGDVTGSRDGLAKMPYIRESRRIKAEYTILEQHVAEACRPGKTLAESYADAVGIGYYRIDLHPSTGGDNYVDVASLPFQIPLGALIPQRMSNLLAGCKNIGSTHITNGCYRLHPVEWNIGEVAGALAAHCIHKSLTPHAVRNEQVNFEDFERFLSARGIETHWPADVNLADGDPHRHAMVD